MAEAPAPVIESPSPAPVPAAAPAADAPLTSIIADAGVTPAPAAAPAIKPDDAKAYLLTQGKTADEIAKLTPEDLTKAYDTAKTAEASKPIEYKDFTLPEGVKVDDTLMADFKSKAAESRLSQEKAQQLFDMHVQQMQAVANEPYKLWHDTQRKWQQEIKADAEIGGLNFESKTTPALAEFVRVFGGDDAGQKSLRDAMAFTGAGNHPAIVKAIARAGAILMEGKTLSEGKPAPRPSNPADTLYPPKSGQPK